MPNVAFRPAVPGDEDLILSFIRGLAEYEHMEDQVVATPELLREWIFEKKKAEVIFAAAGGKEVGFALFFHNYDHSFPLRCKAPKGMKHRFLKRSKSKFVRICLRKQAHYRARGGE